MRKIITNFITNMLLVIMFSNIIAGQSKTEYPNAIYLSKADIKNFLSSGAIADDPNSVVSLLSLLTGLTFRNTGDIGAETWFLVRNFGRDNSRMTLVLIDGKPLNLSNNHTVEFDDIPVEIIESITIYKGPVPAQFGGFQSVIEINTIRNENIFEVSSSMGSEASYRFNATISKSGRLYYLSNFNFSSSLGQADKSLSGILSNFTYTNREFRTFIPTFKIGYEFNKNFDLTLQGSFVDFKKMFGTYPMFGQEASRKRLMHNYSLMLQPSVGSELDYRFVLYQNREQEYLNPVFPEDSTYNVHWGNQKRTLTGFKGYYKYNFIENVLGLRAGIEGNWAEGITDDNYLYFKYINKQNFFGAFLQAEFGFWEGSFITVGTRLDKQNGIDKTYFSPVGIISQSLLNDNLSLYVSYGLQRRWIPLNEVNSFNRPARILGPPFLQGNVELPNPKLEMELLKAFDAGVKAKFLDGKITTRLNYFSLINEGQYGAPVFEIRPTKSGASLPPNIRAAIVTYDRNFPGYDISQGLEFEVNAKPINNLSAFTNITYFIKSETKKYDDIILYQGPLGGPAAQNAFNNSIGQFYLPYHNRAIIPGTYKWLANFSIFYNLNDKTFFNSTLRYRSNTKDPIMKFGKNPNVENIPSVFLTDLSVGREIFQTNSFNVKATLLICNLFDSKYQTFVHYPMQGRFYSLGLSANVK